MLRCSQVLFKSPPKRMFENNDNFEQYQQTLLVNSFLQQLQQHQKESEKSIDAESVYSTSGIQYAPAAECVSKGDRRASVQVSRPSRLKTRNASLPTVSTTSATLPLPTVGLWSSHAETPFKLPPIPEMMPNPAPPSETSDSSPGQVPEAYDSDSAERQARGRRVHRDAEKQRRESLRIGFERLKELLPERIIGSQKNWSQTRLLESGLEYIQLLKLESAKQERDARKLKEVVRQLILSQKE
ncbi:hypothetical protein BDR26DRAFT_700536 [Obelidium mucronatum]|nr:hypothetical protein BDR26DRAFT_700536 [Obelidium mucronatum]